jgi:hypothetical protein
MGVESIHCFNSPRATMTPSQPGSSEAAETLLGTMDNMPKLSMNAARPARNMPKAS